MPFTTKPGNIFNRSYAHAISSQDVYVSGFYGLYLDLPPMFEKENLLHADSIAKIYYMKDIKNIGSKSEIEKLLAASVHEVTGIPNATLNVTQQTGMNGLTVPVPTNISVGNTISVTFNEFFGTPIAKIFRFWREVIRSRVEGTSALAEKQYKQDNWCATAYYWTLAPNALDQQIVYRVRGVFPSKDADDLFNSSNADSNNIMINMDFNCGLVDVAIEPIATKVKTYFEYAQTSRKELVSKLGKEDGSV